MRDAIVEEVCTITAKGQTTVPKAVRQALGVGYGGRIAFRVEGGAVTVRALPEAGDAEDPALAPFLARSDVTDIYVNRPCEVWIESLGGAVERIEVPALTAG